MQFIFTCDDVGAAPGQGPVDQFEMVTEMLEGMGIPGTFFWIPRSGGGPPADEAEFWMPAILAARERGHDFQLHGHVHDCFEFGMPQESIRRHAPRMYEAYDADPAKYEREWEVPRLARKFDEAVEIYERAFGGPPLIFRAACFGIGANGYEAMYGAGLRYSSSRSVNPAATGYVFTRPFEEPPDVLEIPCMEDLVIKGLTEKDFDLIEGLFKRDLGNYLDALGDFPYAVFGSHYGPIAREMKLISRLYERVFGWLADERGVDEWVTFGDVLER